MNVIVLAAGHEYRYNEYHNRVPQFLVDLNGKPLLNILMEKLSSIHGISKIIVVANDMNFEKFSQWKMDIDNWKLKLEIINDKTRSEKEMLGAISDICLALKHEEKQDTLIIGGDNWFSFNLEEFIKFAQNYPISVITTKVNKIDSDSNKFGFAKIINDKIVHFAEKDDSVQYINKAACVYFLSKNDIHLLLDYEKSILGIPKDQEVKKQKPGKFIEWLIHNNYDVFAWQTVGEVSDKSDSFSEIGPNFLRIREHVRQVIPANSTWEKDALGLLEKVSSIQQLLDYLDKNKAGKEDPNIRILSALLLGYMNDILSNSQKSIVINALKVILTDDAMNIPSEFQADDDDIVYVHQTAATSLVKLNYADSIDEVFRKAAQEGVLIKKSSK